MDYKLKLNWQEDENAPRGTRYYVEIEKLDDWNTSLVEVDGTSWQDAMAKAIDKLQETGAI
jgi:hypothetical protein